jgi:hypothetical protein
MVSRQGDIILDEYIEVTEPIVDYLTRFSGLASGDLNAATSPHSLSSLKVRCGVRRRPRVFADRLPAAALLIPGGVLQAASARRQRVQVGRPRPSQRLPHSEHARSAG